MEMRRAEEIIQRSVEMKFAHMGDMCFGQTRYRPMGWDELGALCALVFRAWDLAPENVGCVLKRDEACLEEYATTGVKKSGVDALWSCAFGAVKWCRRGVCVGLGFILFENVFVDLRSYFCWQFEDGTGDLGIAIIICDP